MTSPLQKSIILALVPCDAADQHSAILEVRAGKLRVRHVDGF